MNAKLFARKCSVTGKGMNQGWVINNGEVYIAKKADCAKWVKDNWNQTINQAYKESEEEDAGNFYWTEWEDVSDYQFIEIEGELYDISEFFNL